MPRSSDYYSDIRVDRAAIDSIHKVISSHRRDLNTQLNTNMATLFTVPIASTGGAIVCSNPSQEEQNVYLLTFTSPQDNRLTPSFIDAMVLALDIIEQNYPKGVVITTSGIAKFYSNGLDLDVVASTDGFLEKWLWRLFRKFLTYVHNSSRLGNVTLAQS